MHFDAVLFDFDGTVADTSPGIKEALAHSFKINGVPEMSNEEMDKFIGPPLTDSFEKYCGASHEKSVKMVADFREKYHSGSIDKFIIYDGIEKAFKALKERGVLVVLATSKPQPAAEYILKKAGLYEYFDVILGATFDEKLIKKADIVSHLLNSERLSGKMTLMVGDTEFDIIGAHDNNVPAMWVRYGFGDIEKVAPEKPEFVAETVEDMIEIFKTF